MTRESVVCICLECGARIEVGRREDVARESCILCGGVIHPLGAGGSSALRAGEISGLQNGALSE